MNKYYDWSRSRALTDVDGCAWEEWPYKHDRYSYTIEPDGFRVFLTPAEIAQSDEYINGDPYHAEDGLKLPFHQRRIDLTLRLLQTCVTKNEQVRILDVACGEGHITAMIASSFLQAEVSALDCSLNAIKQAFRLYQASGIDFAVANAYMPPYAPAYFNVAVCNNIWEHVPDPLRMLQAILQVLAPGGYLVLSTPSRYSLNNLLRALLGRNVVFMSRKHVTEYTVGQVIEQLRFVGMDILRIISKPIKSKSKTLKGKLICTTLLPMLRTCFRVIKSHHSLESTVFYLAQKNF